MAIAALLPCGLAFFAGHHPAVEAKEFGPGLARLVSAESGRLVTALGGLLLLAAGQLAWLIRWARGRSLRDFRGGYRIWWWTSFALSTASVMLLTEAHIALGATLTWLTGRTPFGSESSFRLLPGLIAMVVLLPALQRDMRGCRTSRMLVLTAAAIWLSAGAAMIAGAGFGVALAGLRLPAVAVHSGLMLLGVVAVFSGLLFHARHVIYESVEPPDLPVRKKKERNVEEANSTKAEPGSKAAGHSRRASSGKSTRADAAPAHSGPSRKSEKEKPEEEKPLPASEPPGRPIAKPPLSEPGSRSASVPPPKSLQTKPNAANRTPAPSDDDFDDEPGTVNVGGRRVRLDGPEDSLQGLSKRERRKLRKAMRDRGHADN